MLRLHRLADKRGGLVVVFHNAHAHEGRLNKGDKSPTFISPARRRRSFLAVANSANLEEAYFFCSFCWSATVSLETPITAPVMASTFTSVMSLVPGVEMSKDQMTLPFSLSISRSSMVPPGTLSNAILCASA